MHSTPPSPLEPVRLGRAQIDDQGVRSSKWMGLFGRKWSLPFESITSWAPVEQVMASRERPEGRVTARIVELHHAGGLEAIRWTRNPEVFERFVAELERRLPGKRGKSLLEKLRGGG